MYIKIFIGIMLPLFGTTFGSFLVFFLKRQLNNKIYKLIIGFSIGIMLSASIFSLIIPSIQMSNDSWFFPSIGVVFGFLFLIIINKITDKKFDKLMFSITLHNIPEGMAVGVAFASVLSSNINLMRAFIVSLGIALQNIPEGMIISLPLKLKGNSRLKSFVYGFLSGIVEPIFSIFTIILLNIVVPLLPFLLSFASGAMLYVIFDDLVLQIHEKETSNIGIIGIMIGFVLMMALDISFS